MRTSLWCWLGVHRRKLTLVAGPTFLALGELRTVDLWVLSCDRCRTIWAKVGPANGTGRIP